MHVHIMVYQASYESTVSGEYDIVLSIIDTVALYKYKAHEVSYAGNYCPFISTLTLNLCTLLL